MGAAGTVVCDWGASWNHSRRTTQTQKRETRHPVCMSCWLGGYGGPISMYCRSNHRGSIRAEIVQVHQPTIDSKHQDNRPNYLEASSGKPTWLQWHIVRWLCAKWWKCCSAFLANTCCILMQVLGTEGDGISTTMLDLSTRAVRAGFAGQGCGATRCQLIWSWPTCNITQHHATSTSCKSQRNSSDLRFFKIELPWRLGVLSWDGESWHFLFQACLGHSDIVSTEVFKRSFDTMGNPSRFLTRLCSKARANRSSTLHSILSTSFLHLFAVHETMNIDHWSMAWMREVFLPMYGFVQSLNVAVRRLGIPD